MALSAAAHAPHLAGSWHYFVSGVRLLTDLHSAGAGLHLYHTHPQLQIGPVAFLAAWPLTLLPAEVGVLAAAAAMSGCGLLVLALAARMSPGGEGVRRRRLLLPGLLFVPVWEELAVGAGHLDDVLALTLSVIGLRVALNRRPVAAAVLLAVAVDCKPWAVAFLPILLVASRGVRGLALAVWAVTIAAAWLPFVIADPQTLAATRFQIDNSASSALRALGVGSAATPPWCRPAQAILGMTAGTILVVRRRPEDVLLAGIAARMLLDPGTWRYYTAGLLAGTVLTDLTCAGRRAPWFTIAAAIAVYLPSYVYAGPLASPAVHGWLRAAYLIGALISVCLAVGHRVRPHGGDPPGTGRGRRRWSLAIAVRSRLMCRGIGMARSPRKSWPSGSGGSVAWTRSCPRFRCGRSRPERPLRIWRRSMAPRLRRTRFRGSRAGWSARWARGPSAR